MSMSPEAQAVMDAVEDDCIHPADTHVLAAAALEALADQVVPYDGVASSIERIVEERIRTQILAIAAELRGDALSTSDSDFCTSND